MELVETNSPLREEPAGAPARFYPVDIAKGILIIAVVFSHAWYANADILGDFFPYAMPAFFFLSGYTYKPGRGYWPMLRRRAVQLLLPYLCFSVVCNLLYPLYLSLSQTVAAPGATAALWLATLKSDALNMLMSTPMWFLTALFTGCIIFFALADQLRDSLWKTALAVVVLLAVTIGIELVKKENFVWHIDYAPFGAAMLFLGSYCGGKKLFARLNLKGVLCGLACLVVCYGLNHFFPGSGKTSVVEYVEGDMWYGVLTAFAIALTGSIGILMVSKVLNWVPGLRRLLIWCGQNSIWILCIHYAVIMLIELKLFNLKLLSNSIMQVVAVALFGFGWVRDTPQDILLKSAVALLSIGISAIYVLLYKRVKRAVKAKARQKAA